MGGERLCSVDRGREGGGVLGKEGRSAREEESEREERGEGVGGRRVVVVCASQWRPGTIHAWWPLLHNNQYLTFIIDYRPPSPLPSVKFLVGRLGGACRRLHRTELLREIV